MSATPNNRSKLGALFNRSVRLIIWSVLSASLLLGTGQVSCLEIAYESPSANGNRAFVVINDAELNTVYGKGEHRQGLSSNDPISVILWDEGKRKGHIYENQMDVLKHGQLDAHHNGKPSTE